MSILSCKMLEDELTHVLSADKTVEQLIVVDTAESEGLARKLRAQNRPFLVANLTQIPDLIKTSRPRKVTLRSETPLRAGGLTGIIRRMVSSRDVDGVAVIVHVLKLGLHVNSTLLKQEVYRQIECISRYSDGILVLYGVCDALRTLESDFEDLWCPLYFLTDKDGARVEDCIALALGGNDSYAKALMSDQGIVLFLTPMWAANWGQLQGDLTLLKHARFKKVAKVETGCSYEPDFDANANELAELYKLNITQLKGNTNIIERCYERAKRGTGEGTRYARDDATEIVGCSRSVRPTDVQL